MALGQADPPDAAGGVPFARRVLQRRRHKPHARRMDGPHGRGDPRLLETGARAEAPDLIVSLHSHSVAPSVEPTCYVPHTIKMAIQDLSEHVRKRYASAGLPHQARATVVQEDGTKFPPPSFNLC